MVIFLSSIALPEELFAMVEFLEMMYLSLSGIVLPGKSVPREVLSSDIVLPRKSVVVVTDYDSSSVERRVAQGTCGDSKNIIL